MYKTMHTISHDITILPIYLRLGMEIVLLCFKTVVDLVQFKKTARPRQVI